MKKRLLYLVAAALMAMLIAVPSAFGQATMMMEGTIMEHTMEVTTTAPLPPSGGPEIGRPALILPAAGALLLGSGVLAYTTLRHRR